MNIQNKLTQEIHHLLTQKELNQEHFPLIDQLIQLATDEHKQGNLKKEDLPEICQAFGEEFLQETINGHALRRPYGYAGDFLIIDKIYTFHKSENKQFRVWDEYFHQTASAKAVRNRKTYFKRLLKRKLEAGKSLKLLNIASGPARDLFELYQSLENKELLTTTCVEMDPHAIEYARTLNHSHLDQIEFIRKNIFKFESSDKYDLIWSAGLFDYFDDQNFLKILSKLKGLLLPGGEIVIGNFNEEHNPTRDYMEIFGNWFLHHRTDLKLYELARTVGFLPNEIEVGEEEERVNLFLHMKERLCIKTEVKEYATTSLACISQGFEKALFK
ncbi:MAG: class I SAM-dependent methyltransferase [Bacteroidota bacterium]